MLEDMIRRHPYLTSDHYFRSATLILCFDNVSSHKHSKRVSQLWFQYKQRLSKLQKFDSNKLHKQHIWLRTNPTNESHFIKLKLLICMSQRVRQLKSTLDSLCKIFIPLLSKLLQRQNNLPLIRHFHRGG